MSYVQKCDMCGKIEGKSGKKGEEVVTTFNHKPIAVRLKNHRGHKYNVYATIIIEHNKDTQTIQGFVDNDQDVIEEIFNKAMKAGAINPLEGQLKTTPDGGMSIVTKKPTNPMDIIFHSLENPEPMICDRCKRIMLQYCQKYGKAGEPEEF